jgi:hypothetical protein
LTHKARDYQSFKKAGVQGRPAGLRLSHKGDARRNECCEYRGAAIYACRYR